MPDPSVVHVLPVRDLIDHEKDTSGDCICSPDVEYVEGCGKIIIHHSLDGRENRETPDA